VKGAEEGGEGGRRKETQEATRVSSKSDEERQKEIKKNEVTLASFTEFCNVNELILKRRRKSGGTTK
jgi:hypothetical protein